MFEIVENIENNFKRHLRRALSFFVQFVHYPSLTTHFAFFSVVQKNFKFVCFKNYRLLFICFVRFLTLLRKKNYGFFNFFLPNDLEIVYYRSERCDQLLTILKRLSLHFFLKKNDSFVFRSTIQFVCSSLIILSEQHHHSRTILFVLKINYLWQHSILKEDNFIKFLLSISSFISSSVRQSKFCRYKTKQISENVEILFLLNKLFKIHLRGGGEVFSFNSYATRKIKRF